MFRFVLSTLWLLSLTFGLWACADDDDASRTDATTTFDGGGGDGWLGDLNPKHLCSDPKTDHDADQIPNGMEGCLRGRDTDGDGIPDWQDIDSDGDMVPDSVEAGPKVGAGSWPRDSDGDGVADVVDRDSDNDKLPDGDEDRNGDGLVGCCVTKCGAPDRVWQMKNCVLNLQGCGPGQTCSSGLCTPAVDFVCSAGETSARTGHTFAKEATDPLLGTHVCRKVSTKNANGYKQLQVKSRKGLDYSLALDPAAVYGEATVKSATTWQGAATIDHTAATGPLAGFVASFAPGKTGLIDELTEMIGRIRKLSGLGTVSVSIRASGTMSRSHDLYPTIRGTILDVSIPTKSKSSEVRAALMAAILGKPLTDFGNLPAAFGSQDSAFVVRLSTVWRYPFKRDSSGKVVKDSKGSPLDSGDKTKRQVLVLGGVARAADYQDPKLQAGFLLDDLSSGLGLALAGTQLSNGCDALKLVGLPMADIIWVVDESPSMRTHQNRVVNNANNFFSRALASGLDFRMGVTGVNGPSGGLVGKFCSTISSDATHDGGTDRFLLPTEQAVFSSCIKNPPGNPTNEYGLLNAKEAVKRHLPRSASSATAIRKGATLVVIVVSDEPSSVVLSALGTCGAGPCQCPLPATDQAKVDAAINPYLNYFNGSADPEAAALFHYVGKPCHHNCPTKTIPGYGYQKLASALGGQAMDICQTNLGNSLQVIIDTISGQSSPIRFSKRPIPGSIAATVDGMDIKRSRINGFDYRSNANSLALVNVRFRKGSRLVMGYTHWDSPKL